MNAEQIAYLNSCPPGDRHEVTVNGVTYVKDRRSPSPSPGMMFSNDFVVGQRAPLIIYPPPPVTFPYVDPGPPPPPYFEVTCSESSQN